MTIFEEMTSLAVRHGAINLGQGLPDEDGPSDMAEAARAAILAGANQYAPAQGIPRLREAIAEHQRRCRKSSSVSARSICAVVRTDISVSRGPIAS